MIQHVLIHTVYIEMAAESAFSSTVDTQAWTTRSPRPRSDACRHKELNTPNNLFAYF